MENVGDMPSIWRNNNPLETAINNSKTPAYLKSGEKEK